MNKTFIVEIITILALATCLSGCSTKESEKTGLEGKPMTSFNMLLMDSTSRLNSSNIPAGKPVVFLFISPFCPYCQAQTEDIIANIQSLSQIQFYIITTFPFTSMKEYADHYRLGKYKNIIAGQNYDTHFVDYFKVNSIPYIAIYDKDKILKKVKVGKIDVDLIKEIALGK